MGKNKTGKYLKYAIGEIALVMIGILLALQVNNWNEDRKERVRGNKYLERLKEDISSDLEKYNMNFGFYNQVFDYGNLALSYAEGEDIASASHWEILVAFFHASQIWPIIPFSSTYEELMSSGELSLVQSIDIRNGLSYFHGGGLNRYNGTVGIRPPYRKMVRGLIPSKVQNYMWNNCHVTLNDAQILKDCDPFIKEEESKKIIDDLSKNTLLIDELRFYMSSIKVGMPTIVEQQKLCEKMLNEIDRLQKK